MATRRSRILFLTAVAFSVAAVLLAQSRLAPPMVFVIIGPPGSGKSTQAKLLGKKYKIPPIDMAELVKSEVGRKSNLSETLKISLASGDLITDEAANNLINARLLEPNAGRGFILDGYPRTADQARFLDGFLKDNGLPSPKVILLESPDDVDAKRMIKRRRADDKPEIIQQRLADYREDSKFLSDWYQTENVMRVDATLSIEQVAARIDALIADALVRKAFHTRE